MTRRRKKITEGYQDDNLIKIEGQGQTATTIFYEYLRYINDEQFSLTTEDIANYLSCSYQYVTETILPHVTHIRINESARSILVKHSEETGEGEEISHLFMKRVLFQVSSFKSFIMNQAEYKSTYRRFIKNDFDEGMLQSLENELEQYNEGKKKPISISWLLQSAMDQLIPKYFTVEPVIKPLSAFPSLLSQREIMEQYQIPYKVSFYRMIERQGINKVHIGNLVRYVKDELEEDYMCWMYESLYNQLLEKWGTDFSGQIGYRAKQLIEELNEQ